MPEGNNNNDDDDGRSRSSAARDPQHHNEGAEEDDDDNRLRRRKADLAEELIRVLLSALDGGGRRRRREQRTLSGDLLTDAVLRETSGLTTVEVGEGAAAPRTGMVVSSTNPAVATTLRTTWNPTADDDAGGGCGGGAPLELRWVWHQNDADDDGKTAATCNLCLSAPGGLAVEFFPPTSLAKALLDFHAESRDEVGADAAIATLEVTDFRWILEASTTTTDDAEAGSAIEIESSWHIESATVSMVAGDPHGGGDDVVVATEEVLLEARSISLLGTVEPNGDTGGDDDDDDGTPPTKTTAVGTDDDEDDDDGLREEPWMPAEGASLRLRPKASLSLAVSPVGTFEGSDDEEKLRIGFVLRTLVDFADRLVAVPDAKLLVDGGGRRTTAVDPARPPLGGLGDALTRVLRHHVGSSSSSSKPFASTRLGEIVLEATARARDGVAKARRTSKLAKEILAEEVAADPAVAALGAAIARAKFGVARAARESKRAVKDSASSSSRLVRGFAKAAAAAATEKASGRGGTRGGGPD